MSCRQRLAPFGLRVLGYGRARPGQVVFVDGCLGNVGRAAVHNIKIHGAKSSGLAVPVEWKKPGLSASMKLWTTETLKSPAIEKL